MRDILILVAISLFVVGCDNEKIPRFPEITKHYAIDIPQAPLPQTLVESITNSEALPTVQEISCLEFDIVSTNPYKIAFSRIAELKECAGVGGYRPDDMVSFLNWVDDVTRLASKSRNCFK